MSTRNVYIYPGHVGIDWTGSCERCEVTVMMSDRRLVDLWEATHAYYGCRVALALHHAEPEGWHFCPSGFLSARKIRAKPRKARKEKISKEAS